MSTTQNCLVCGADIVICPSDKKLGRGKYCSHKCQGQARIRPRMELYEQGIMLCPRCGETKSISLFGKDKQNPLGISCYCSECLRIKGATGYRRRTGSAKPYKPFNPDNRKLGARRLDDGYIFVNIGCGKWRAEHRRVFEEYLGRPLETHEQVHHINGIKTDNRLDNLFLLDIKNHSRTHFNLVLENAQMKWEILWLKQKIELIKEVK